MRKWAREGPRKGRLVRAVVALRKCVMAHLAAAHELHILSELLRVPTVYEGEAEHSALLLSLEHVNTCKETLPEVWEEWAVDSLELLGRGCVNADVELRARLERVHLVRELRVGHHE